MPSHRYGRWALSICLPGFRMFINITPVPKPRMTQSDRWKKRPAVNRYYAFCDELRLKYKQNLGSSLQLVFYMPMPHSWSKKKQLQYDNQPHQQRPDVDNLIKSVFDALCEEDSYIYKVNASKYWSSTPGIVIVVL